MTVKTVILLCSAFCVDTSFSHDVTKPESKGVAAVKADLVVALEKMSAASEAFNQNATRYQEVIDQNGTDYAKAILVSHKEVMNAVVAMQGNYKAVHNFGYEAIEGMVAGIDRFKDFDVYLDAGVPGGQQSLDSPEAGVSLKISNGKSLERQGSLFHYIIEPSLWGSANPDVFVPLDLDGDGKISPKEGLPRAEVLCVAVKELGKKIKELLSAVREWQPTTEECFAAMIAMTPTFSGYFDEWRDSKFGDSGKFAAVSRVSDMRNIMSGVALMYDAVEPDVETRDLALALSIKRGFTEILAFIDRVARREQKAGGEVSAAEIEEMTSQANGKADKLVPQIEQAAALLEARSGG